jgi:dTDP-4-amino-4,6-dideoxygalactose transaminase
MRTIPYKFEEPIRYAQPTITIDDLRAVERSLTSGWIAGRGIESIKYAEELSDFTGYKYAIPVANGTLALEAAYMAALHTEILQPTRVTMPDLTFIATYNAWPGTDVEIIDVDEDTLVRHGIDVGVSFAGYPSSHNIVCDNAHFLRRGMASFNNKISTVSTHAIKPISTGEGGVVLANDESVYWDVRATVDHGRGETPDFGYGSNYRLSDILCALGRSQLKRADDMLFEREEIAKIYYSILGGHDDIILPMNHEYHNWHLFVIRFKNKELRDYVKFNLEIDHNVFTQIHYKPLSSYWHVHQSPLEGVAKKAYETGLSIPMHNSMSFKDARKVAGSILYQVEQWKKFKK